MENQIKCIIVEDYEPLNRLLCNLLNYEKDIVVTGSAFESNELCELLKSVSADIILMDIEIKSRTEGIETCRKILRDYPTIKIIMLTCHDEEDMILSAFEAGAVDYLLKTSSSSQILDAVRSAYADLSPINSYVSVVIRKRMKEFGIFRENLLNITAILSDLTHSELGILKLLLQSKKQKEIASAKTIEIVTVKAHVSSILKKFNCSKISEVVKRIRNADLQNYIENMKEYQ